jgi:ElaB/YqjD/DUF883 family membrane-anchored ribosome-binding protein
LLAISLGSTEHGIEERDMYESNGSNASNGGSAGARAAAGAEQVKEHLRAAKDAAAETLRDTTREARTWSRGRFSELQDRVEAEPYRAAAWALGIGFVVGVVVTLVGRSGRR